MAILNCVNELDESGLDQWRVVKKYMPFSYSCKQVATSDQIQDNVDKAGVSKELMEGDDVRMPGDQFMERELSLLKEIRSRTRFRSLKTLDCIELGPERDTVNCTVNLSISARSKGIEQSKASIDSIAAEIWHKFGLRDTAHDE